MKTLNQLTTKADALYTSMEDENAFTDVQDFMDDVKVFLDDSITYFEAQGGQVEGMTYESRQSRLTEVIADISMTAGYMIAEGKISIDDSREFVNSVVPELARQFESDFTKEQEDDGMYMEMVDDFAIYHLTERYGVDNEPQTVQLYIGEGDRVYADRKQLIEFVTKEWDYANLQEFLDGYIWDDAYQIYKNLPEMFIKKSE